MTVLTASKLKARVRDSGGIAAGWPRTGPRIRRNARRRRAAIVFWDESGVSLLPVTRRSWAPRGHTPVLRHRFKWRRMSMAAGLCYGSRGGGALLSGRIRHAYDIPACPQDDPLASQLSDLARRSQTADLLEMLLQL